MGRSPKGLGGGQGEKENQEWQVMTERSGAESIFVEAGSAPAGVAVMGATEG